MHYFTFADKDSTIYQQSSSINTGLDEVLEIRKDVSDNANQVNVSRILIRFPLTYISASIMNGTIPKPGRNPASSSFFLNLFDANPTALATSQSIYAYPISQSWTTGDGRSYDNPATTEGSSWSFRNGITEGLLWDGAVSQSGATWFSGSSNASGAYEASYSFSSARTQDVRMDVTDIVTWWLHGTGSNEGFIVKRNGIIKSGSQAEGNDSLTMNSGSDEGNSTRLGNFSFFSSDTHTKFPPTLEAVWDDSIGNHSTGSLQPITGSALEDMVIYMKGLRPEYHEKSKIKFRVVGRERFPVKTFSTTPSNLTVKYLPSGSSFYSIVDAETNDVVVPFGSGSKLSCDSTGNYFKLWLDGYQPERYYKLKYRAVSDGGSTDELDQYFDEGFTFKVTKED